MPPRVMKTNRAWDFKPLGRSGVILRGGGGDGGTPYHVRLQNFGWGVK